MCWNLFGAFGIWQGPVWRGPRGVLAASSSPICWPWGRVWNEGCSFLYADRLFSLYRVPLFRYGVIRTYSVEITVCGVECSVHCVHSTVHSVLFAVYYEQSTVCRVQCTVYSVPCTAYSVPCTAHHVHSTVYSAPCPCLVGTACCKPCAVHSVPRAEL